MSEPDSRNRPIGIFGGAFAPFHNGHLRLAIEARIRLQLAEVRLVPTAQPPHRRDSNVPPERRLEWLRHAIARERGLVADDCELRRDGPSYTVDTLSGLRRNHPDQPLVLLLGADAFAHLQTWHCWREIPDLAHLAVVARPGVRTQPAPEVAERLAAAEVDSADALLQARAGRWLRLDLPVLDISSTRIRRLLKAGHSVRGLVPDAILAAMTPTDLAQLTRDDDATTH